MAYARDDIYDDELNDTLQSRLRTQYAAEEPVQPLGEGGAGPEQPLEAAPFTNTGPEAPTYQTEVEPTRAETPIDQGFVSQWNPGATAPSNAPQGMQWSTSMANYEPIPQTGGPTGGGGPEAFIREWQSSHPSSEGIGPLAAALQQKFGIGRYMYGSTPSGNEILLNGQKYKVIGAEGTPGQYWYQPGMDDSAPAAPYQPRPMQQGLTNYQPTAQGYTPFSVGGMQAPQGLWGTDFTSQLRQILMQRLAAAGKAVDPNDPNIQEPLTAARNEATRGTERERAQLAERLYGQGQGLNTGELTQQIQQSNERNAVGLGTLRANLITREVEGRKNELQQLLSMAFAAGDAEASREIQSQIAQLNAMLQREGFQVQREGIGANLAINAANQNRAAVQY